MSVTPKAIHTMYARPGDESFQPVVQVLSVAALSGQKGRFKIILSDGENYTTGLLSSTLTGAHGGDCPYKQYQLVRMDHYKVSTVQEKNFVLVNALTEMGPPLACGQLGNPVAYKTTATSMVSNASNPYPPTSTTNPYAAAPAPYGAPAPTPYGNPYQQSSAFQAGMQHSVAPQPQVPHVNHTAGPVRYLQPTEQVIPMSHLTIYTQKWTIKARVSTKSDMRTFRNARGEGQLMTVDIVDTEQTEMRATFFGAAAQKFHVYLQIGKVYTFSKGSVKPANPKFNPKAQYELMFDEHSEIKEVADDTSIPTMKINLVPIGAIADIPVGESVDIAGIVTEAGEVGSVTVRSTGRETSRRSVTVADDSGSSIEVTVWGDKAMKLGDDLRSNPVIFIKACRVGDYNGRSLSTAPSSIVEIDPDHPRSFQLKSWWIHKGGNTMKFAQLSERTGGAGGAPNGASKRTTINAMREEDVASLVPSTGFGGMMGGDPSKRSFNSHTLKAVVIHIPLRDSSPIYYKSCPTEVDDGRGGRRLCQKKTDLQGDCYVCAEQHVNRNASARYILSMRIQDATGECLIRAFHDQARSVLGIDASEIDSSPDPMATQQAAIQDCLFQPYMFKIRSKKEIHMDEEKTNMIVTEVVPVNPTADAKYMLGNIEKFLTHSTTF